jgi:hypothetical protein
MTWGRHRQGPGPGRVDLDGRVLIPEAPRVRESDRLPGDALSVLVSTRRNGPNRAGLDVLIQFEDQRRLGPERDVREVVPDLGARVEKVRWCRRRAPPPLTRAFPRAP